MLILFLCLSASLRENELPALFFQPLYELEQTKSNPLT